MHAFNYGLRGETDPAVFKKIADEVIVPEFTPKSGVKVQINDNDPTPQNDGGGMHTLAVSPLTAYLPMLQIRTSTNT